MRFRNGQQRRSFPKMPDAADREIYVANSARQFELDSRGTRDRAIGGDPSRPTAGGEACFRGRQGETEIDRTSGAGVAKKLD